MALLDIFKWEINIGIYPVKFRILVTRSVFVRFGSNFNTMQCSTGPVTGLNLMFLHGIQSNNLRGRNMAAMIKDRDAILFHSEKVLNDVRFQ